MRILILAPHPHIRGPLPKNVAQLAEALGALGCSVRLEGWGRRRENETPAEKARRGAADLARIRRILAAERFEMMVLKTAHDWKTLARDIPLLLATRRSVRHRVVHLHGSRADRLVEPGRAAFKLASALLARLADAVFVLSREEQRQWAAFHPGGDFRVVRNPFRCDADSSPGAPRDRHRAPEGVPVVLFVGRLLEVKGLPETIAALPEVIARTPCHLVIAGEGPLRAALEARIANAGLGPHVTLAGYLEDDALRAAYAGAEVFVLPSRSEGFPYAILEAMSFGLPVVTTRIRGMVDHLGEGVHALLVPPGDPRALAAALARVLGDAELRERMGRANRDKVREYAPEIVAREYLATLREVAARSRRTAG